MKPDPARQDKPQSTEPTFQSDHYEILVEGQLQNLWGQWFEGMELSDVVNGDSGAACTLIAGPVADQPALHGLLIKIRDLNLKLVSVRRVLPGSNTSVEISIPPEPPEEQNDSTG